MARIVADSSSLILLAKCGLLEIVCDLYVSFIVTPKIVCELFRLQKISFKKARESIEKLGKIGRYSPEIIAMGISGPIEIKKPEFECRIRRLAGFNKPAIRLSNL
jgi:hypothetical protein